MSEDILERIKEDILEKIMNCVMPLLNKKTTVIFTGGKADAEGLLKTIDGLLTAKPGIVASDNFMKMAPPAFKDAIQNRLLTDYADMQKHIASSDLVVIPILTRNTISKAAAGIQDNLVTCGLASALMRNIPVIAVRENFDPTGAHFKDLGLDKNPVYNEMLKGHERKLASFGVKFVDTGEFSCEMGATLYGEIFGSVPSAVKTAVSEPSQTTAKKTEPMSSSAASVTLFDSFITCEDLMKIPSGASVSISGRAVLTPLAKEYLERKEIKLIRL
jgi:hypothetical protein